MPEIKIEVLRKEFKEVVAVKDVSVTFRTGMVTCLLGPSGCGKTTLMRMIAGLEKPTSGSIYFDDVNITGLPPEKRNIGMVFQYPVVYRGMNVYKNIDLPLVEEGLTEVERKNRIEEIVDILNLRDSLYLNVDQIDNSTRQRVAVARAVARRPQIILFDEPLTNVDVATKVQLKHALKKLTKQYQQTIIYVTHDQTEAMTLADEIALMNEGEIIQKDSPRKLYSNPNTIFGGWFLGNPGMNFIEARVKKTGEGTKILSELLKEPINVDKKIDQNEIIIGVRPEEIEIGLKETEQMIECKVLRKSIVIGGQYLISAKINDKLFKVKVSSELGYMIRDKIWIRLPIDKVTFFDKNGSRIDLGDVYR